MLTNIVILNAQLSIGCHTFNTRYSVFTYGDENRSATQTS